MTLAFALLSHAELPAMCVMVWHASFLKAKVALGVAFCVCVMSLIGLHQLLLLMELRVADGMTGNWKVKPLDFVKYQ